MGVIGYELLTGKTPFEEFEGQGLLDAKITGRFPRVDEICPEYPEAVGRLIEMATARRPEQRFQSAQALRIGIEQVQQQLSAKEPRLEKPVLKRGEREERETLSRWWNAVDLVGAILSSYNPIVSLGRIKRKRSGGGGAGGDLLLRVLAVLASISTTIIIVLAVDSRSSEHGFWPHLGRWFKRSEATGEITTAEGVKLRSCLSRDLTSIPLDGRRRILTLRADCFPGLKERYPPGSKMSLIALSDDRMPDETVVDRASIISYSASPAGETVNLGVTNDEAARLLDVAPSVRFSAVGSR